MTIHGVTLAWLHNLRPGPEIIQLSSGILCKEVVGNPDGQEALSSQLADRLIVIGIVLEATPGVDH